MITPCNGGAARNTGKGKEEHRQRQKEEAALNTENPGYFGTVVGALKLLMGFDGGDTKHRTYVESLLINTINQTVTLTCCNHGMRYSSNTVLLASFANNFLDLLRQLIMLNDTSVLAFDLRGLIGLIVSLTYTFCNSIANRL